jgi:hypothetical protein
MTTLAQDQPILTEWLKLSEAEQKKSFPSPDHHAAADLFARHADQHRQSTGDFIFRAARNMAVIFSKAAIEAALTHNVQTAHALARVVSLEVGSPGHRAAIQTLMQLCYHKEAKPKTH